MPAAGPGGLSLTAAALSSQALAYLGDALFEVHVRARLLHTTPHPEQLHRAVVSRVRATTQALVMKQLESRLTESEQALVRRARNAYRPHLKRMAAPHYRHSTAFEALLGQLYLAGERRRLDDVLAEVDKILEEICPDG